MGESKMKKTLRASLDRIENDIAVFVTDEGETLNFRLTDIPEASEGVVYELLLDGETLAEARRLEEETNARLERAQARLRKLFKNK